MINVDKIRLIGLVTVDFPISVAHPSDSYILKGADGLGPPPTPVFISMPHVHKGEPENRQPVLRVGLNPNFKLGETAASLRSKLYGMLTPEGKDSITLQLLHLGEVVAERVGYVERIEIVPFTKEPEVQITMTCAGAYLEAPAILSFVPDGNQAFTIANQGNAPSGFELELTFTAATARWQLTEFSGSTMNLVYQFIAGDVLRINTNYRQRRVEVYRGGRSINIIHALTPDSSWLFLRGGNTQFNATSANLWTWVYFRYTPKYWGI